jgi:hypothetical protein
MPGFVRYRHKLTPMFPEDSQDVFGMGEANGFAPTLCIVIGTKRPFETIQGLLIYDFACLTKNGTDWWTDHAANTGMQLGHTARRECGTH